MCVKAVLSSVGGASAIVLVARPLLGRSKDSTIIPHWTKACPAEWARAWPKIERFKGPLWQVLDAWTLGF